MVSALISRFIFLTAGTLYPAYRSYKAVRTKDVREYVKWMMYWIVFALFLIFESFADIFVSFWMPFYFEIKILFVIWLLCPYTKGASLLYRKFIHPTLMKNEREIDLYMDRAKNEGYHAVMRLGSRGILYAREAVANAAVAGQLHLVNQLRKTQSLNDISNDDYQHDYNNTRHKNSAAPGGLSIEEIIEEDEEDTVDGRVSKRHSQRIYAGHYEGERIVEEELYMEEEEFAPGHPDQFKNGAADHSSSALRRSARNQNKPPVHYDDITDGYATLPRSHARQKRRTQLQ